MNPSASLIIIGNEILSGRTADSNTREIALELSKIGISLSETAIIPDDKESIIETLERLKPKYDYVFTTGGIGPTHDDITAQAVAEFFGLPLELNEKAYREIKDSYLKFGAEEFDEYSIKKMSKLPKGAFLIENPVSGAPGFNIENIYVMAGVPYIMSSMLKSLIPRLKRGDAIISKTLDLQNIREGLVAEDFEKLQKKYENIDMGSYPFRNGENYGTSLVLRSSDLKSLSEAYGDLLRLSKEKSWT